MRNLCALIDTRKQAARGKVSLYRLQADVIEAANQTSPTMEILCGTIALQTTGSIPLLSLHPGPVTLVIAE